MITRDTSTGLAFEDRIRINEDGINVSKHALYRYLKGRNINWQNVISRQLLPDEAYFHEDTGKFNIYEKKTQKTEGSAEENLGTQWAQKI